jgi:hypothetical protein
MATMTNSSIVAVTRVVSDALETPLEELPPLSQVIDVDALQHIVSANGGPRPPEVTVGFEYAGLKVFVHSGGVVYTRPIDAEAETSFHPIEFDI